MTEQQAANPASEPPENDLPNADEAAEADEQVDPSPKVQSAADAVRRAEAELKKAREFYQKIREDATEQLKKVRETTVGDVVDGTLRTVERHPGPSVLLAMAIGFCFGRLFRR